MTHSDNELPEDDPRVTAYALGELSGAERLEFEAELRRTPSLQREVADIQAAGALLSAELKEEKPARLAPQNISAQQHFPEADPWFSGKDVNQERPSRYQAQKG